MKKRVIYIVLLCVFVAVLAFRNEESTDAYTWPKPYYTAVQGKNAAAVIDLGRALFYDPILSSDSSISCASCHTVYNAFAHVDHALSHGIQQRIGRRNAPALMNVAWSKHLMWDGAIQSLEMQALAPIQDSNEMNETLPHVLEKLNQKHLYQRLSKQAWGRSRITSEIVLQSMAAFVASLVSRESKYDSVMRHQAVFTPQEENGYLLFRRHCAECHTEPLFTNGEFRNNGLAPDSLLDDIGRQRITHNPSDAYLFKVPSLRNVEFSFPYMHDGRFKKLKQVIDHYVQIDTAQVYLSTALRKPITLTVNEKVDLIAFLLSLSDRHFTFNPNLAYPKNILGTP
jgi:cytochrome c peroxidase